MANTLPTGPANTAHISMRSELFIEALRLVRVQTQVSFSIVYPRDIFSFSEKGPFFPGIVLYP